MLASSGAGIYVYSHPGLKKTKSLKDVFGKHTLHQEHSCYDARDEETTLKVEIRTKSLKFMGEGRDLFHRRWWFWFA